MSVNREEPQMSVKLAKQLLYGKGVYLTEEGKRRLQELLKKKK